MVYFSIIITTFNRADVLYRSINSVMQQTYRCFELIVVDDASQQNNKSIIDSFNASSNTIHYIRHDRNQGVSAARNTGIQLAKFSHLVFLDDDDAFQPNYLATLNQMLATYPTADFVWCGKKNVVYEYGKLVNEENVIYKANSFENRTSWSVLRYWSNNLGVMIRKRVFEQIGVYDTALSTCEDLDLLLRMLSADMNFVAIPEVLVTVYIDSSVSSLSRQTSYRIEADNLALLISKNQRFLSCHQRIFDYYLRSLIIAFYRSGQKARARRWLIRQLKHRPFQWRLLPRILKYELSIHAAE